MSHLPRTFPEPRCIAVIVGLIAWATLCPVGAQIQDPPEIAWERTIPFEPLEPQFNGCGMDLYTSTSASDRRSPQVALTPDGGYLLSGEYHEGQPYPDPEQGCGVWWQYAFLRKYDGQWNLLWTRYVAEIDLEKRGSGVPTADGGAVLAGMTYTPDFAQWAHFIARFDAQGRQKWFNVLTPFVHREVRGVTVPIETSDGGFAYCALETEVGGPAELGTCYLFRTDASGQLVWKKSMEGIPRGREDLLSVREVSDGGFLLFSSFLSGLLRRVDAAGEVLWTIPASDVPACTETPPGTSMALLGRDVVLHTDLDGTPICRVPFLAAALAVARDGGVLVSYRSEIKRLDVAGTVLWTKKIPSSAQLWRQEADGGFLRISITETEISLTKLAPEEPAAAPRFRRGDSNGDATVNLTDAVFVLRALFQGGAQPTCADAADADDSGALNISDPIYLLQHLFLGQAAPPPPGTEACGPDPTADALACAGAAGC